MKKIIKASLSLSLLLGACSNDKESATKIASTKSETKVEKQSSDNHKVTSQGKNSEVSKTESLNGLKFVSKDGDINFASPDFYDYYFKHNHIKELFGIQQGMSEAEVEKILGKPDKEMELGTQMPQPTKVYGEIGVYYSHGKAAIFHLVPREKISRELLFKYYGEPSYDSKKEVIEGPNYGLVYFNDNPNNGFYVGARFANNKNVIDFYQDNDEILATAEKVNKSESHSSNRVNVLSEEFVNQFNKSPDRSFAGVKKGMTLGEVEDKYGKGEASFNIARNTVLKYGNLGVLYSDGLSKESTASSIFVLPDNVTKSDIIEAWGEPQYDTPRKGEQSYHTMVYDGDTTNDYIIVVGYEDAEKVLYIEKEDASSLKYYK